MTLRSVCPDCRHPFSGVRSALPVILVLAGLTAPGAVSAQPPTADGPQWTLGLGLVASPSPYVGVDADVFPIPVVGLRWDRFYLQGVRAGYALAPPEGPWRVDLLTQVRFQGYEADDSPFLRGMEDRDFSLDAGVLLGWQGERWSSDLTLLTDVLDESGGQEAALTVARTFRFGRRLQIAPEAGVTWQSEDLVDHYYGVRPDEARPFRPAYEAGSTLDGLVGVQGRYLFARRLSLFYFLRAELLGGEVEDSPIVDDDTAFTALVGLTWAF